MPEQRLYLIDTFALIRSPVRAIALPDLRPTLFRRHRLTIVAEPFILVEGALQHKDGVTSIRAERLWPLRERLEAAPAHPEGPPSHDFH